MWPALISIGLGLLNFGANAKGADAKNRNAPTGK